MNTTEDWAVQTRIWDQSVTRTGAGAFRLSRRYQDGDGHDRHPGPTAADGTPWQSTGIDEIVRFVDPIRRTRDRTFEFEIHASQPLAGRIWPIPQQQWGDRSLNELFTALGRALARLHRPTTGSLPPSVHLERFRTDLAAAPDTASGRVFNALPGGYRDLLTSWTEQIATGEYLCHGSWTLGSMFAESDSGTIDIPIGQEVTSGPRELDVGWLIGELTEFEFTASRSFVDGRPYARSAAAFLDGYADASNNAALDQDLIEKVVAIRYALHQCDYLTSFDPQGSPDAGSARFLGWLVQRQTMGAEDGAEASAANTPQPVEAP